MQKKCTSFNHRDIKSAVVKRYSVIIELSIEDWLSEFAKNFTELYTAEVISYPFPR